MGCGENPSTSTLLNSDFNDVTESLEGQQHFHSFLFNPKFSDGGLEGPHIPSFDLVV